jgi:predicted RNA-binding Zn-ribbon protein involved in translation (DUF1610 family)
VGVHTDFKYLQLLSHRLRNFKELEQFKVNFSCPVCGDSKKVKWKARGYIYIYQGKTFFKCQNCGEAKSFGSFLRYLDEGTWSEWRKESVQEEPTYKFVHVPKLVSVKKDTYDRMVNLLSLPEEHIARVYVNSRRIPLTRQRLLYFTENYRSLVEEVFPGKGGRFPEDERLVIPIYNKQRELVAISGRSMNGSPIRYATAKSDDQKCFFGLERMVSDKPVLVTEGPIDALFLPNAVAVCHAELSAFGKAFPELNSILIFDNEPANPQIVKNMEKALEENMSVCVWADCPFKGKDINEMVKNGSDIRSIVSFILANSHKGPSARMKMISWKGAR